MTEGPFSGGDGTQLYERQWKPVGPTRCAVVIIHGYGHHSGSFDEVAQFLTQNGYMVYGFDQRGFGKASGKRGVVPDFDATLADTETYLKHIGADGLDVPLFLIGHSYGGLVLANYVVERQPDVRGLIFSSALLKLNDDVPAWLQNLAGFLGKVLPWVPVAKVEIDGITRDPERLAQATADPLCFYGRMRARTGAQIAAAVERIQGQMESIKLPFLAMAGSGDRVVDCEGTKQLCRRASSEDKTMKIYEGAYHEIYNDINREEFLNDLAGWIYAHL